MIIIFKKILYVVDKYFDLEIIWFVCKRDKNDLNVINFW